MNRRFTVVLLLIFAGFISFGQTASLKKPKLVVGIVVDQMRFDHLYKYESKYSEGGFKRIIREGFNYKNMQFNYVPTVTAAGHSSIYTGTTPATHGVIGNSWFDRSLNDVVVNVSDTTVNIVGSTQVNKVGVSPKNLLTTTISDQLRLGSNFKSKVISVSLKDRGAILPGGHTPNGAYWHDWVTSPGYFVSSSYYMDQLPNWVTIFNKLEKSSAYLDNTWNTLNPIEDYTESAPDDNKYERSLGGKKSPTFPYDFKSMREKYRKIGTEYQLIWVSPYGNTLLTEFAMEAIKSEKLGADDVTDMLSISYSVTDLIGHTFGPQSVELEDIYLRLDRNIEDLLYYLDRNVGKDNYLLFLTADHAAIHNASYLNDHKLPAGVARIKQYKNALTRFMNDKYGKYDWIQYFESEQLYLNRALISKRKLKLRDVQQDVADFLINLNGISGALTAHNLQTQDYSSGIKKLVQNGYHPKRSGDVLLVFDSGFIQYPDSEINLSEVKGTTHGSGYAYDWHVPMLWMGSGIPHGESVRKVAIPDISASLAMFLNLQQPSGSSGNPLIEIFQ